MGWKCSMHTGWCMHSVGNSRSCGLAGRPKRKDGQNGRDTSAGPRGQGDKPPDSIKGKNFIQLISYRLLTDDSVPWSAKITEHNWCLHIKPVRPIWQTTVPLFCEESLKEYCVYRRGTREQRIHIWQDQVLQPAPKTSAVCSCIGEGHIKLTNHPPIYKSTYCVACRTLQSNIPHMWQCIHQPTAATSRHSLWCQMTL